MLAAEDLIAVCGDPRELIGRSGDSVPERLFSSRTRAAEWGRRKNLGEEAIQHCRSYAFDAERKMGELLRATERAVGTNKGARKKIDGDRALPSNPPPTLNAIKLSDEAFGIAEKPHLAGWGPYFPGDLPSGTSTGGGGFEELLEGR